MGRYMAVNVPKHDEELRRTTVEPTLVVIGISFRSAKLPLRERFLLSADQKTEALAVLVRSHAIDEVIVLSNCIRTEFLVWTQDASEAADSILRYLTSSVNLKLAEWSNFYRLVGCAAVVHVLRVASGGDAAIFGEAEGTNSFFAGWQQAERANTTGRYLCALRTSALTVASQVRQEVGSASNITTVAEAAVAVCVESLGDLRRRRVVVLGAGQMALAAVRELQDARTGTVTVVNRSWDRAQRLAQQRQIEAAHAENLWGQVLCADAVISAASQRVLLTREALEPVMRERKDRRIVLVDLSVPRTVDRGVRLVEGVTAFDLDDLCAAMGLREHRRMMLPVAERIIVAEASGFLRTLVSESVLPTICAVRERLELICAEEVDKLGEQFGPFLEDEQVTLRRFSAHISQRITADLARQLQEKPGQSELTRALQRLLQLDLTNSKAEAKTFE